MRGREKKEERKRRERGEKEEWRLGESEGKRIKRRIEGESGIVGERCR